MYLNGVISGAANQNSGTPVAGTNNVLIGNNASFNRTFDGIIAKPKIWNRVLTEAEIQNIYENERLAF